MPRKPITLLILLIAMLQSMQANQSPIFRHLDIVNGMSDNQIRGLNMLPDGRITIRTASILNLYNGATFEHFYHDKSKEYKWNYWGLPKEYLDSDNQLWMKERDYLLLLDLSNNRFVYNIANELAVYGIKQKIKNMFIDTSKNKWFVTESNDFVYYDNSRQQLIQVTAGNSDFGRRYGLPKEIAQYKNFCWIVFSSGMIACWDYSSREFVTQDERFVKIINDKTDRIYIHTTSKGDVWLMHNNGLSFLNRTSNQWKDVASISGRSNFFTCMDLDPQGNVWIGTSLSGLRFVDNTTHRVQTIQGMQLDNGDVLMNDIFSVFVDDNNGLWVGTLFQGLCYYHPGIRRFSLIQTVKGKGSMTSENVRCFLEEKNGSLLIGTAYGLFRFNPVTETTEAVFPQLANEFCIALCKDSKQRIWASTYLGGFYCIEGNNIKNYKWNKPSVTDQGYNNARYLYEDPQGRYWVSINNGLAEFFPETGNFSLLSEKHPKIAYHKLIYEIYPVDDNTLGMLSESGIFFYNTLTDSVYIPEIDTPNSSEYIKNTRYYCVFTDSRSLRWMATERQLNVWDAKNQKMYSLTIDNGLPSNTISKILEDDSAVIWASTANGISKIKVELNNDEYVFSITNFGPADGLQSGKFYGQSGFKSKDGTFYFGGVHGFNYFKPSKIQYNTQTRVPVFTAFSLFNSLVKTGDTINKRILLSQPINVTKEIRLNHHENFISIDFAGLNYVQPSQTFFKYKLENFDQDWTEIVTNGAGRVTYTGLRPGMYRLMVYTANNDRRWGNEPAILLIIVKPPFWATTMAYLLYSMLGIILIIYTIRRIELKNRKKWELQQKESERKQHDELAQMKFRFFTNISHEFRTPLTLIITPLEMLLRDEINSKRKAKMSAILKSAHDLLALVNQLLDFRKLEIEGEKIQLSKNNIGVFIENIYLQFKDTVLSRKIEFTIDNQAGNVLMYFDKNKLHKIINNLIINALKFSSEGGHIHIRLTKELINNREFINISVQDTGCGIAEDKLDKIFDRFFQIENVNMIGPGSSGIGLHLVKEYVELHQGSVNVISQLQQGSTFTVSIPADLRCEEQICDDDNQEADSTLANTIRSSAIRTILLVEDNAEFRSFLAEQLAEDFEVIQADDGLVGETMARLHSPDLIISDLMMPHQDGVTLCRKLKVDIHTSHIPFIMLTARNSDEDKTEGYDAGADSYISKPFSYDMLLVRIKKLIEQQSSRQELFQKTIEISPSQIAVNSLDEEFIRKVLAYVEKNIDNTEYTIEDLSSDVGLHRSHLYRKIQSLTGQTPIDFMRLVRLKRAAQLLTDSQYYIAEIAEMVGFNTIKYFNKYFKEEFGSTPTQYRNEHKAPHSSVNEE
ncbi:MAG: hybrid sensor histidine kinase/response regulator [Paludibacter sp. 47-17]|nr:MAG: hybrid sensor histidine kinase/response regulator [Paludibacter sp. 47-17]